MGSLHLCGPFSRDPFLFFLPWGGGLCSYSSPAIYGVPSGHPPSNSIPRGSACTPLGSTAALSHTPSCLPGSGQVTARSLDPQWNHSLLTHSPDNQVHREWQCLIRRVGCWGSTTCFSTCPHLPILKQPSSPSASMLKMVFAQYGIVTKSNPYKYFSGNNCFMFQAEHTTATSLSPLS